ALAGPRRRPQGRRGDQARASDRPRGPADTRDRARDRRGVRRALRSRPPRQAAVGRVLDQAQRDRRAAAPAADRPRGQGPDRRRPGDAGRPPGPPVIQTSTPETNPTKPMFTPAMTSEPAFDLRCRDAEWIDRPTTLDEFSRPAAVGDRYRALTELLFADMIARTQTEIARLLEGRVLLSVENARFGIPVGVRDLDAPPIDDWRLQEQIDVELLDEGPDGRLERSVAAQFRRGLIAVAGALPLLASPILAHAHAPLEPAALARMATGFAPPPKLPEEPATTPTAAPTVT